MFAIKGFLSRVRRNRRNAETLRLNELNYAAKVFLSKNYPHKHTVQSKSSPVKVTVLCERVRMAECAELFRDNPEIYAIMLRLKTSMVLLPFESIIAG
jgi:hypothetical protein